VLVLLVLGVVLVALGALVLLRFPDRPGGVVRLMGLQVSSVGAGLPLIALGVLVSVIAATGMGDDATTSGSSSDTSGGDSGAVSGPPPDDAPACLAGYFAAAPNVGLQRQRSLPAATDDVKVLAAEESKREEFGVVPIDGGTVLGAAKMSYDVVSKRFRIDGLADARCAPLRWMSPNAPGVNPTSLGESSHIRARFGSDPYDIELKPNGTEMEMELHVVRP
jgi:hypothetical protein